MKKFTLFLLTILLIPIFSIDAEYVDDEAPIINVIRSDVVKVEGDYFDYRDFFTVSDNSGKYRVASIGADDIYQVGEHTIKIIAIDLSRNVQTAQINITVYSKEDAKIIKKALTFYPSNSKELNENFKAFKGEVDEDAYALAQDFLGMPGACSTVAQAFINSYYGKGYSIHNTYDVNYWEARPGDIIYYDDGGLGLQHYAVYLGGDSALHGNIYGTTLIKKVYMNYGSEPQFKRIYDLPY